MFNQCRHIMPSGAMCKSPALKEKAFCYYHWRARNADSAKGRPKKFLPRPSLEDPQGIQIALTQLLGALGSSPLDDKRAGLYLYGLQIATQLATRTSPPEPCEVVRSVSSDAAGLEMLAPETVQCEPGPECDTCDTRDQCVLPARVAYLDARQFCLQSLKELDKHEMAQGKGFSQALAWGSEPEWVDPAAPEAEPPDPDSADSLGPIEQDFRTPSRDDPS